MRNRDFQNPLGVTSATDYLISDHTCHPMQGATQEEAVLHLSHHDCFTDPCQTLLCLLLLLKTLSSSCKKFAHGELVDISSANMLLKTQFISYESEGSWKQAMLNLPACPEEAVTPYFTRGAGGLSEIGQTSRASKHRFDCKLRTASNPPSSTMRSCKCSAHNQHQSSDYMMLVVLRSIVAAKRSFTELKYADSLMLPTSKMQIYSPSRLTH
jgi:hypothetical protein